MSSQSPIVIFILYLSNLFLNPVTLNRLHQTLCSFFFDILHLGIDSINPFKLRIATVFLTAEYLEDWLKTGL